MLWRSAYGGQPCSLLLSFGRSVLPVQLPSLLPCSQIEALFWQWQEPPCCLVCRSAWALSAAYTLCCSHTRHEDLAPLDPSLMTGMQVWESAVSLAMTNQRNRIAEVVDTVAQRLVLIGRHEAAAELLQGIDDMPAAVRWVPRGLADIHLDGPEGVADVPSPVRWVQSCCCLTARSAGTAALSLRCQPGILSWVHMLYAWLPAHTVTFPKSGMMTKKYRKK